MKRALIFAGNSFIGRWLAPLGQRGWSVMSTARQASSGIHFRCNLMDAAGVEAIVKEVSPDWVFQCAGATKDSNVRGGFDLHVTGTINVLESVRRHAADAGVLLIGSAAEYGQTDPAAFPIREDQPSAPCSFFGASKAAQTQLARAAAAEWALRIVTVRPFNVIGSGLPKHYFAAALATRLRQMPAGDSREVPIVNANATRDFVDVRDVAAAIVDLAELAPPERGEFALYNIATGIETPLLALAKELGKLAGGIVPVPAGTGVSRGGSARSCGDASLLRRMVGWEPRRSWRESLHDMWWSTEMTAMAA